MKKWSRFYEVRMKRNLARAQVAQALGVSEVTVWRWDCDTSKMLLCNAHAAAKLLDCNIEALIGEQL